MDCKGFRSRHSAFIDDTLPGVEMTAMREHLSRCPDCVTRDTMMRRALLLARNMPPLEVSEGFQDRLRARLASQPIEAAPPSRAARLDAMRWAAAAVFVIAALGVVTRATDDGRAGVPVRLPAVVASPPVTLQSGADDAAPAYVASMSTGIPMWPALMHAEEGPLRFAATELQNAAWDGSRPRD